MTFAVFGVLYTLGCSSRLTRDCVQKLKASCGERRNWSRGLISLEDHNGPVGTVFCDVEAQSQWRCFPTFVSGPFVMTTRI